MKRIACISALFLFAASCGDDDTSGLDVPAGCEEKVAGDAYVAGLLPYTGAWPVGQGWDNAINLAVTEINDDGGLPGGQSLGLVTCDTEGTKGSGVPRAEALAAKNYIIGFVGSGRSAVFLGEGISDTGVCAAAAAKQVAAISPGATNPDIGDIDDDGYCYRTCVHDGVQGAVWAKIVSDRGYAKAYYAYPEDDSYTRGLAEVFVAAAAGVAVDGMAFSKDDVAFPQTILDNAKAFDADVVMLSMFSANAIKVINKWATEYWGAAGPPDLIGPDGMYNRDLIEGITDPSTVEGKLTVTYPGYPGANHATFRAAYESRYNKAPESFDGNAYDAAYVLAIAAALADDPTDTVQVNAKISLTQPGNDAVAIVGGNWAAILSEIGTNGRVNYEGVTGSIDFDAKGDVLQNIGSVEVLGGEFVDSSEPCWTPDGPCP